MSTVRSAPSPVANPATSRRLDDAANGRATLQRGSSGEDVKDLQRALNARGAGLSVDGDFGPQTQAAVKRFQQQSGLGSDGVVGPRTMDRLRQLPVVQDGVDRSAPPGRGEVRAPTVEEQAQRPHTTVRAGDLARTQEARSQAAPGAVRLAPASMSEGEKYDHYARIIRANGGQVNPDGQPTVLGLRGLSRDGKDHASTNTRQYDDTFVVLSKDPNGRPHVQEFRGATHPGQLRSTASPDVTGDGVGDVGTIRPGNYNVVPNGPHAGAASYHVRTQGGSGNLPGWRDTNHDGTYSAAEKQASQRRGDTLNGVLFHQGGDDTPISIGCQTLAPGDYAKFMRAVGGAGGRFNYSLVDGSGR